MRSIDLNQLGKLLGKATVPGGAAGANPSAVGVPSAAGSPLPAGMSCPACALTDIPDDAVVCPNCKRDLMPLWRIRHLGAMLHNRALAQARQERFDDAIASASAALSLNPREAQTRKLLGRLLWRAGRVVEARDVFARLQADFPSDAEVGSLVAAANPAADKPGSSGAGGGDGGATSSHS